MDYAKADQLVSVLIGNALNLSKDKKICLTNFNPQDITHKLFFVNAQMAASLYGNELYIDTSFYNYVRFKLMNWKKVKGVKWAKKEMADTNPPVEEIINYVQSELNISKEFMEKTYYIYYELGDRDEDNSN